MSVRESLTVSNAIVAHMNSVTGTSHDKDFDYLRSKCKSINTVIVTITPKGEVHEKIAPQLQNLYKTLVEVQQFLERNYLQDGIFSKMTRAYKNESLHDQLLVYGEKLGFYADTINGIRNGPEILSDVSLIESFEDEKAVSETPSELQVSTYPLVVTYNDNVTKYSLLAEVRSHATLFDVIRDLKDVVLQVPQNTEIELLNSLNQHMEDLPDQPLLAYFQQHNLPNEVSIRRKITHLRAAGYLAMASIAVISPPAAIAALALTYGAEKYHEKTQLSNDPKKAIVSIGRL
jgi:hypothetical protein